MKREDGMKRGPQCNVRVESDGTPKGTRVFDSDTGSEIHGLTEVRFAHRADDVPRVEASLVMATARLEGAFVLRAKDPNDGKVKCVTRVEFDDGSVWPPGEQDVTDLRDSSKRFEFA